MLSQATNIVRFLALVVAIVLMAHASARETPINPEDPDYLRRQFVWFQSLSGPRQQQLRQLNQEFVSLDPNEQVKYVKVLQRYNAWLAKIHEDDRRRVLDADSAKQRLALVTELKDREWIAALPKTYREEYANLDSAAKSQRVRDWRAEETERHEEWALAQKHWPDLQAGRMPILDKKPDLELFAANLKTHLNEAERKTLDDAKLAADEQGMHVWYVIEIVRLADAHPMLPGQPGPKNWDTLSPVVKKYLMDTDPRHFAKKKGFPGEDLKELKRAQGRWPDFALELQRYVASTNGRLKLPEQLGTCFKKDMPKEVLEFLDKTLEPKLRRQAPLQLEALKKAEGSWPEYPKLIVELAKQLNEPIPGWTLPGPRQMWDRFRPGKGKLK